VGLRLGAITIAGAVDPRHTSVRNSSEWRRYQDQIIMQLLQAVSPAERKRLSGPGSGA
jgi:hypothetical protein